MQYGQQQGHLLGSAGDLEVQLPPHQRTDSGLLPQINPLGDALSVQSPNRIAYPEYPLDHPLNRASALAADMAQRQEQGSLLDPVFVNDPWQGQRLGSST